MNSAVNSNIERSERNVGVDIGKNTLVSNAFICDDSATTQ
jgi:hypothetical protein